MVFIPQGSFVMGPSDQDVPFANVTAAKTVSVAAFYMDETEITNNKSKIGKDKKGRRWNSTKL